MDDVLIYCIYVCLFLTNNIKLYDRETEKITRFFLLDCDIYIFKHPPRPNVGFR